MNIHEIKSHGIFHEYVPMGFLLKKKIHVANIFFYTLRVFKLYVLRIRNKNN